MSTAPCWSPQATARLQELRAYHRDAILPLLVGAAQALWQCSKCGDRRRQCYCRERRSMSRSAEDTAAAEAAMLQVVDHFSRHDLPSLLLGDDLKEAARMMRAMHQQGEVFRWSPHGPDVAASILWVLARPAVNAGQPRVGHLLRYLEQEFHIPLAAMLSMSRQFASGTASLEGFPGGALDILKDPSLRGLLDV